MKKQNLYFLSIVLPEELCREVILVEEYIAATYDSHRSLKIVPHITLKAPFTIPTELHEEVMQWFAQLYIATPRFSVALKDFGCFPYSHPVIYINPVPNPMLAKLQSEVLNQFLKAFPEVKIMPHEVSFKPHVTVAYRDLSQEQFQLAWQEFSSRRFSAVFEVLEFQLLQHNGSKWNTIGIHPL